MSLVYATPILYLNMGGEMLYVLQQRLQTQKISPDKTIQVMNEVIRAMLNPAQLSLIFSPRPLMGLAQLRPILERVVLASIMRLDANSMGKLFDLMIMMVKYQLTTASGPRELILSTLNHLDAIRDMAVERSLGELVNASHRLVLETYGPMTHHEIWQIRNECLREVQQHNVRVSILLRHGMQNQDASFNRLPQSYDEKYQDREQLLANVKLLDYVDKDTTMGQFGLYDERVTLLGKNAYCSSYVRSSGSCSQSLDQMLARSNKSMRVELETLAAQLGHEEAAPARRPFSLHLFQHDNDEPKRCDSEQPDNANNESTAAGPLLQHSESDNNQYKNNLIQNVNSEFADNDNTRTDTMDLMNLLDIV